MPGEAIATCLSLVAIRTMKVITLLWLFCNDFEPLLVGKQFCSAHVSGPSRAIWGTGWRVEGLVALSAQWGAAKYELCLNETPLRIQPSLVKGLSFFQQLPPNPSPPPNPRPTLFPTIMEVDSGLRRNRPKPCCQLPLLRLTGSRSKQPFESAW